MEEIYQNKEKTRSSEMKEKTGKLRNRETGQKESKKEFGKIFPNYKTQISRLKDPRSSIVDENRFRKGASLKNIRAWVTGKILKGSWENKTSLIHTKKNQEPEWHQISVATLEARRQRNNTF